jgi:hypothetical protein
MKVPAPQQHLKDLIIAQTGICTTTPDTYSPKTLVFVRAEPSAAPLQRSQSNVYATQEY